MENLQSLESLDTLFAKIAEIMGVAVDTVQANGMEWLLEYGKYSLSKSLVETMILGLIISVLVSFLASLLVALAVNAEDFGDKRVVKAFIASSISIYVLCIVATLIPYLMSPLMYSIEQAIKLLN